MQAEAPNRLIQNFGMPYRRNQRQHGGHIRAKCLQGNLSLVGDGRRFHLERVNRVDLDLPPKLRQPVKSQNSANGEFDSWEHLEESSRKK